MEGVSTEAVPALRLLIFRRRPGITPAGPAIITEVRPAITRRRRAPRRKRRIETGPTVDRPRTSRHERCLGTERPPIPGNLRLIARPRLIPGATLALIRGWPLIAQPGRVPKVLIVISGAFWRSSLEIGAGIAITTGTATGAAGTTTPG